MQVRHPRSEVIRLVKRAASRFWYARYPGGRFVSLRTTDEGKASEAVARLNAPRRRSDLKRGFVYVIAAGDRFVKIGCTNDLTKRLDHIQTHNPDPARVVVAWRGSAALEADLHRRLAAHRAMREWYPWDATVQGIVEAFGRRRALAPEIDEANAACARGNARAAMKSAAGLAAFGLRSE